MSESNWADKMIDALDRGFTATAACMLNDRFAAQEQATRDLETRLAALEDAIGQVASGCERCGRLLVAWEPDLDCACDAREGE